MTIRKEFIDEFVQRNSGKQVLRFLAIAFCLCILSSMGQQPPDVGNSMPMTYELYSWQEPNGHWNFRLLSGAISREYTVKEIFDRRGVLRDFDGLERKIRDLPSGTTILAMGPMATGTGPKAKGSERLCSPTADMIVKMKRLGEARNIKIVAP